MWSKGEFTGELVEWGNKWWCVQIPVYCQDISANLCSCKQASRSNVSRSIPRNSRYWLGPSFFTSVIGVLHEFLVDSRFNKTDDWFELVVITTCTDDWFELVVITTCILPCVKNLAKCVPCFLWENSPCVYHIVHEGIEGSLVFFLAVLMLCGCSKFQSCRVKIKKIPVRKKTVNLVFCLASSSRFT